MRRCCLVQNRWSGMPSSPVVLLPLQIFTRKTTDFPFLLERGRRVQWQRPSHLRVTIQSASSFLAPNWSTFPHFGSNLLATTRIYLRSLLIQSNSTHSTVSNYGYFHPKRCSKRILLVFGSACLTS